MGSAPTQIDAVLLFGYQYTIHSALFQEACLPSGKSGYYEHTDSRLSDARQKRFPPVSVGQIPFDGFPDPDRK